MCSRKNSYGRTSSKMRLVIFSLFNCLAFTISLFGCGTIRTHNINVAEITLPPQPLVEPLPFNVGVHYSEDFRTFDTIQQIRIADFGITSVYKITLGKANIALFDYILPHAFEQVTPVQHSCEDSKHTKNIDLIIEPTVADYSLLVFPSMFAVRIKYAITFCTPDGEGLKPQFIEGYKSVSTGMGNKPVATIFVELTEMAMREVAAEFMTGVCKQEEIKQLFCKQSSQ